MKGERESGLWHFVVRDLVPRVGWILLGGRGGCGGVSLFCFLFFVLGRGRMLMVLLKIMRL